VECGLDEDGDMQTTCLVQWEPNRPPPIKPQRRMPPRRKTSLPLEQAIDEVGLPAEPETLRAAFYKHHGGSKPAANMAWHRAVEAEGLKLRDGKLDYIL
jgi:hypothetical protein